MAQLSALKAATVPAAVPPPAYAEDKGATDLAFARAKDKAGLLALARQAGSRTALAQRGMTGSGMEGRAMDSILGDAQTGLADVATAQAGAESQRAGQVADRNYAGALQQRGHDIGANTSLLSLLNASRRQAVY